MTVEQFVSGQRVGATELNVLVDAINAGGGALPAPVQETVTLVTADISVATAISVPSNAAVDILVQFESVSGRFASDTIPSSWLSFSVVGINISATAIPLNLSQDRRLYVAKDSSDNLLISVNNAGDVGAGTLRVTFIQVTAP